MSNLLTPTDESVLQMAATTLRSLDRATLADELNRVAAKLEDAFIAARERGYDDARSTDLPSTDDLEADFRRWLKLNPFADLRSAWIAGVANEKKQHSEASTAGESGIRPAGDSVRKEITMSNELHLSGKATDHIWLMEDMEGYIGIRMDSGDSGTVYVTASQAQDLAEQLLSFLPEPAAPLPAEKLRALAELSAKATAGEWSFIESNNSSLVHVETANGEPIATMTKGPRPLRIANADFTVACVNYVREALAAPGVKNA